MKRYIVTPIKIETAQIAIMLVCFDFSSCLRDATYIHMDIIVNNNHIIGYTVISISKGICIYIYIMLNAYNQQFNCWLYPYNMHIICI